MDIYQQNKIKAHHNKVVSFLRRVKYEEKYAAILNNIINQFFGGFFYEFIFRLTVIVVFSKNTSFLHFYKLLGELETNMRFNYIQNTANTMLLKITVY